MRWLKRDRWRLAIPFAGLLLLLMLMVWVPMAASAYEGASETVTPTPATVQTTPTVDVTATMTALNEEKLRQEIQQLKSQNEPTLFDWLKSNISILLLGLGAFIGFLRWLADRQDARNKDLRAQAEERFKTAVAALGDKNEGVQVNGAILLRSFLHKSDEAIYGRYYTQIFDLAVAYLRLPSISQPSEDPDGLPPPPVDPNAPLPLTPLRQALIVVFKEVFPLARNRMGAVKMFATLKLDATRIRLDGASLVVSDLDHIWMKEATLRNASLLGANLRDASLGSCNLMEANLTRADLTAASLNGADLTRAILTEAVLTKTDFIKADLTGADLSEADLTEADLGGATLNRANLTEADLSGANIGYVLGMQDADLRGVKGLSEKQLKDCKAKGAIIDEDTLASPSQSNTKP
jgi:uncharacterized protein YjbI with pentapeptide repeats